MAARHNRGMTAKHSAAAAAAAQTHGLLLTMLPLLRLQFQFADAQACDISQDRCETQQNNLCEANGDIFNSCPGDNSDCFDCDPLNLADIYSCTDCIDQGGHFCWGGPIIEPPFFFSRSYCHTPQIAQQVPDACFNQSGGSAYYDTCESTPHNGTIQDFLQVCDTGDSSCAYQRDGTCDAGSRCAPDTDCFDCDPLQEIRHIGCQRCIEEGGRYCFRNHDSAGGNYVPSGFCSSPELAQLHPNACIETEFGGTPFVDTCFSEPITDTSDEGLIQHFLDNCKLNDTDTCAPILQDGNCNAASICPENSDCLDCDPLQNSRWSGCHSCIQNGGQFCFQYSSNETNSFGRYGFCNLPAVTALFPDACINSEFGGTEYVTQEDECGPESYSDLGGYETPQEAFLDLCNRNDATCGEARRADGSCDAGRHCLAYSDCIDCDPFNEYKDNCFQCVENGGQFCTKPDDFGGIKTFCNSPEMVEDFPDCNYTTTCELQTCDWDNDPCPYKYDGQCDSPGTCPSGSDCYDCQECAAFRFDGCDACTSAGCVWCGADALCLSPESPLLTGFSCSRDDFVVSCPIADNFMFSDPLFEAGNWIFDMINLKKVWEMGYSGKGIKVLVNDDGLDTNHPEIAPNFDEENSCKEFLAPEDPSNDNHGTTVASIVAAAAENNVCGVGIAPNASIAGCAILRDDFDEDELGYFYIYNSNLTTDVSQNSYGPQLCRDSSSVYRKRRFVDETCPFIDVQGSPCAAGSACETENWNDDVSEACEDTIVGFCRSFYELDPKACASYLELYVECYFQSEPPGQLDAFVRGVQEGREGKGIIYVFSAGNDYAQGSTTNYDPATNSRFTISVGAVGRNGKHSSYSEPGSALFMSAPGGDFESSTNHVTAKAGSDGCHEGGVGTSFSAPVVSGVVALMLEANPDLTWRDVQGIFATSSQQNDESHESWGQNGANISHSYLYGFGVVDAHAAVSAALSWDLWGPELQFLADSSIINLNISGTEDDDVVTSLELDAPDDVVAESAVVFLQLQHASRGDLEITLISPTGFESILTPGSRPENQQPLVRWKLMTLRHWGEPVAGTWKLRIVDKAEGDLDDECSDLRWDVVYDDSYIDCYILRLSALCNYDEPVSQEVLDDAGLTAAALDELLQSADFQNEGVGPYQACCACGGGTNPEAMDDLLISWRLQVYGHSFSNQTSSPTVPATSKPVTTNTPQPSPSPTRNRLAIPTSTRTGFPTLNSTEAPSQAPQESSTSATISHWRNGAEVVARLAICLSVAVLGTIML